MSYLICISAFILCYLAPGMLVRLASREDYEKDIPLSVLLVEGAVLSFWLILLPCLVLANFSLLSEANILALIAVLIGFGAIAIFRSDNRTSVRYSWGVLGCVFVVGFHAYEVVATPAVRGGFFYLSEIAHIVEARGIPENVLHFGEMISPQIDKLGFDITGACYFLLGAQQYPLEAKEVGYLGFTLLAALAVFLFSRRFLSLPLASVSSLAVLANAYVSITPTVRNFFIPESTALFFAIAAWFSMLRLIGTEKPKWPLNMAGLSLAASALTHLEIGFIAALGVSAMLLILVFVRREGVLFRQFIYLGLFSAVFFFGAYAVAGSVPPFLESSTAETSDFFDEDGADVGWKYFQESDVTYAGVPAPLPLLPGEVFAKTLYDSGLIFREHRGILVGMFLIVFSLLLSLEALRKRDERFYTTSAVALASLGCIIVLLALAVISESTFQVWVYRTEATRRLAPYVSLFLVVIYLAGFELAARIFETRIGRVLISSMFVGAVLITSGLSLQFLGPLKTPFPLGNDGIATLRWLEKNTDPQSVVLSNVATNGAFHVVANRHHLLEGHQPMLRPALVKRTNALLRSAKSFFESPEPNMSFLDEHHVTHVILSDTSEFGGSLYVKPFSENVLPEGLCKEYENQTVTVYRRCHSKSPSPRSVSFENGSTGSSSSTGS